MKKLVAGIFVLLLFIIINGCGKKEVGEKTELKGGIKGGGIYRINELENIRSLDPVRVGDDVSHHVSHQIYDLLVDLDTALHVVPALATSWDISDDALTYTFHLRKGVMFQDNACFPTGKGREMIASDVKYSLDRVCDPRTGTLGFDYYKNYVVGAQEYFDDILNSQKANKQPTLTGVTGYIVQDDSTFQIKLKKPFGPFIYYLTQAFAYVIPKEAVDQYGKDFFQNPVGTGPYMFRDWKPDFEINLKRNPHYWQMDKYGNQLPYVEDIKFKFLKEVSQQLLEFRNGNLDECYRIPNESFREIITPEKTLTPEYVKFRFREFLHSQFNIMDF